MPTLGAKLELEQCPHCSVNRPNFVKPAQFESNNHQNTNKRIWCCYSCGNCGGVVTASADGINHEIRDIFPKPKSVSDAVPLRAKAYLEQAINSVHAPSGAIMLAASSVDAMLKEKNNVEGGLYQRIQKSSEEHLITDEMAQWAHDVRLDANDQRHADTSADLPDEPALLPNELSISHWL
jgi:hypothetical protein